MLKTFLVTALLLLSLPCQAGWMMERFDSLAGSEWRVVTIGGQPATEEAFLQFRVEGKVAGNTGVNQLAGSYKAEGNGLRFGPLVTTRMAGSIAKMAQESRLLAALGRVDGFQRHGRIELDLRVDGRTIVTLRQTDWD